MRRHVAARRSKFPKVHDLCGHRLLVRQHVRIDRQREGDTRVTKAFADDVWRHACGEQLRRVRVPEAMERDVPDSGLLLNVVERPKDVAGAERSANLARE